MAVGELFLSAFLQVLFDRLGSRELLNFVRRDGLRKKLERWSETLKGIEAVLADADEKQHAERAVKNWLDDLRDLAYDLEDILDEFFTETMRCKASFSGFTPRAIKVNMKLESNIKEITGRFNRMVKQKDDLKLSSENVDRRSYSTRETLPLTSVVTEAHVYGRDSDKEALLEFLVGDKRKLAAARLRYQHHAIPKSSSASCLGEAPLWMRMMLKLEIMVRERPPGVITGGAAATVFYNLRQRHPTLELPLIDYDLALLFQPMLVLGISIGVSFNVIFAEWMITILLAIIFTGLGGEEVEPRTLAEGPSNGSGKETKDSKRAETRMHTGVVGGLLGLGGGFILGPLFLEQGIPPQVSSATAPFAMSFSSSMSVVEYYLLKRFLVPYVLYFLGVATIAALVGQHVVTKVIAILGRASLIIFILAGTIFFNVKSSLPSKPKFPSSFPASSTTVPGFSSSGRSYIFAPQSPPSMAFSVPRS
ncbi:hypothetical protein FH972_010448 [Carpinus fangiana]|uniref:Disease resistance N-terminal domain-containing protein n=1 Tax=Carpinus fangiana TaxID=176857 RepID=A0A660KRH7_9ROSI|nr:hypothetical protein FH972_010448 [Carpinus fangiana]